jgi:hypothetical protein
LLAVEVQAVLVVEAEVLEHSVQPQAYLLPLVQHTQLLLVLVEMAYQLTLRAKALMVEIPFLVLLRLRAVAVAAQVLPRTELEPTAAQVVAVLI